MALVQVLEDHPAPVVHERSQGNFVSEIPWYNEEPDCFVICCSDHRFEQQVRDLIRHLGFERPHIVQVPSGVTLTLPLTSSFGFLSKAIDKVIDGVIEMKKVKTMICIGHQDCGAYKMTGKNSLINTVVRYATGKSVVELQHKHLSQAAHRIRLSFHVLKVRVFFASVVGEGEKRHVEFEEIPAK